MASLNVELRQAMKSVGGRKGFKEQAEQYRSDSEYLEQNQERLLQEYPEQWIAVYKGKVQAVANDARTLLEMIGRKQLSPNEVVISFLSSKETIALF